MNIIVKWQIKFDDKLKNHVTFENTEIVSDLKK